MTHLVQIVVALIGLALFYSADAQTKTEEAGRILFLAGVAAALFTIGYR